MVRRQSGGDGGGLGDVALEPDGALGSLLAELIPDHGAECLCKWREIVTDLERYLDGRPPSSSGELSAADRIFCEEMSQGIVDLLRRYKVDAIVAVVRICRALEGTFPKAPLLFATLSELAIQRHHLQLAAVARERSRSLQDANDRLCREVENRKKMEAELLEFAERLKDSNRELEQFAHVASHDLKEPLTLILAFGRRLQKKCATLDERAKEYVLRLVRAAERMNTLVDDLLAMSRVSTMTCEFQQVDLTELMREVVEGLEERIEKSGGRVVISPLGHLGGDPTQLRQLFQNIISNALKYREADRAPEIAIKRCPGMSDRCEIVIEDNGIGFDPLMVEHIFRPFTRLHGRGEYDGSGIGLATCRKIVVRHGGEITARSVPGVGSTFIVRLPCRCPCPLSENHPKNV